MDNSFTLHRLGQEITELEQKQKTLQFEVSQIEPMMKREIDVVERKFGTKRTATEGKLRQVETALRSKKTQLQQLEKKIRREKQRANK